MLVIQNTIGQTRCSKSGGHDLIKKGSLAELTAVAACPRASYPAVELLSHLCGFGTIDSLAVPDPRFLLAHN
jgi:hypothetical protein